MKHNTLHLPSVPETASPNLTEFEMKSMAEHSNPSFIELKDLAKGCKADDYTAMTVKYSRNLDAKTNNPRSSQGLGAQEPGLTADSDAGTCQNVKENWCSGVQVTSLALDIAKIPHDTSRMSSIHPALRLQCVSPYLPSGQVIVLSCTSSHQRQQTEPETGALWPLPLFENSPKRTSVSIVSRNILDRANTNFEVRASHELPSVANSPKRSHVYDGQSPTYPCQPAGIDLTDEEEDENREGEGPTFSS